MATAEKEAVRIMGIGDWVAANPAQMDAVASLTLSAGWRRNRSGCICWCLRMLRNSEDADIATQDAFQGVPGSAKSRRPSDSIAREVDHADRRQHLSGSSAIPSLAFLAAEGRAHGRTRRASTDAIIATESGASRACAGHRREDFGCAGEAPTPRQRSVFVLRHEENRRLEEIGEILQVGSGDREIAHGPRGEKAAVLKQGIYMNPNHWTDERMIGRLYGLEADDGHIEACKQCRERWEMVCRRKKSLVVNPAIPEDLLACSAPIYFQAAEQSAAPSPIQGAACQVAVLLILVVTTIFRPGARQDPGEGVPDTQLYQDAFSIADSTSSSAVQPIQSLSR